MYNFLWIDDEHDSVQLQGMQVTAIDNEVKLHGYRSLEGLDELEKNYSFYDGILLDAKFYKNENDSLNSEDTDYIHRAKERILALPKKFKIFVLTGQAEAYNDNTFSKAFKNVYQKGSPTTINRLFPDMIAAANEQTDTQVKHDYKDFFRHFTVDKYGMDSYKSIVKILAMIKTGNWEPNDLDYFASLRIIIEKCFRKLNHAGVLHDECIKSGKVNLLESNNFLNGKNLKYTPQVSCAKKHFPYIIADNVKRIINTVGASVHSGGGVIDKRNIEELRSIVVTPYLLSSLTLSLLDIVIWSEKYIGINTDIEYNKTHWLFDDDSNESKVSYITGFIMQDEMGNYHCEGILLNYTYIENNNFYIGDEIEIQVIDHNSNSRNKELYKKFAVNFKKI